MVPPHVITTAPFPATAGDDALFGCRVLLAEDSPPARALYVEILNRMGAVVISVADGGAALKTFRQSVSDGLAFDIVILDHDMPILDGIAVAAALRADGFRGVLLGLTAGIDERDAKAWRESGCVAMIPKALSAASIAARFAALRHSVPPENTEQEKRLQNARRASPNPVTSVEPFENIRVAELPAVPPSLLAAAERLAQLNREPLGADQRRHFRRHVVIEGLARPVDADFQPVGPTQRSVLVDLSEGGARLFCTRHPASRLLAIRLNAKHVGAAELAMKICRVTPVGLYYDIAGAFVARFNGAGRR